MYASSVFLEEGPASFHLELLDPLLAQGVTKVKVRVGPEWRETWTRWRRCGFARPERRADGRRQRDLHPPDSRGDRPPAARARRAVVRGAAAAGRPRRHRGAGRGVARADRLRRAPLRRRRGDRRHAARAAAGAAARRVHVWRPGRGPPHGRRRGGIRRPRGSSRVRRADLAGGQPAPRRHRAGHPARRVPADVGRVVVDVRARVRARPEDDRRRQAGGPGRPGPRRRSRRGRAPTATRTVHPVPASPAPSAACPIASSAIDDLS